MESDLVVYDPQPWEWTASRKMVFQRSTFVSTIVETFHKFSDNWNARKQQLERSLSTISGISWAASQESESDNSGPRRFEGFVHEDSSNRIWLGCLKRVFPEKPLSDTGEIQVIQAAFEEIHPCRGNAYRTPHHKTISWRDFAVLSKDCDNLHEFRSRLDFLQIFHPIS